MFRAAPNPYDEIVVKATDENQTSENWEVIISLCDKVLDEGENGSRNVVAAILKRLAHRTSNVQLYALSLAEALSKNCTIELHRELASRSFTQGLEKLITDRNTHDKVRRRALGLVATWAGEFESDPTLGIMNETYENLKAKNFKFDQAVEPAPPEVDDEIRRREEEELQRVLELSMQDKGGRNNWISGYPSSGPSSSGAGSSSQPVRTTSIKAPPGAYPSGYTPSPNPASSTVRAASPSERINGSSTEASRTNVQQHEEQPSVRATVNATSSVVLPASTDAPESSGNKISRVRALHTFEPTEAGELGFEKGDVIKVVDRGYKDWWRGQLRGRTGIFPVNYVEVIPEPTEAEIALEAQQEAQVFAQAAAIDQLLEMLRRVDPLKDNLADNEEIQELYRSSMTLRPKIVKLIDRYSQKREDLVAMNENFVRARRIFDQAMEESLAKHNPGAAVYEYARPAEQRPEPRARPSSAFNLGPTGYGWSPSVYGSQQTPHGGLQRYPYDGQGPAIYPTPDPTPQYPHSYGPSAQAPTGYGGQEPVSYQQTVPAQVYSNIPPQPTPVDPSPQGMYVPSNDLQQGQPRLQSQLSHAGPPYHPSNVSSSQGGFNPQAQQPGTDSLPHSSPQQELANPTVTNPTQAYQNGQTQPILQPQSFNAVQQGAVPTEDDGPPPYPFDPNRQYKNPNVQAWASYYAGGGNAPAGLVYFIASTLPVSATTTGDSTPDQNREVQSQIHTTEQPAFGHGQIQMATLPTEVSASQGTYSYTQAAPSERPDSARPLPTSPTYTAAAPFGGPQRATSPHSPTSYTQGHPPQAVYRPSLDIQGGAGIPSSPVQQHSPSPFGQFRATPGEAPLHHNFGGLSLAGTSQPAT